MDDLYIKQIEQHDGRTLKIVWTSGEEQLLDTVELRRHCPCAVCIDEWTHQPKLRPEQVADTVRPIRIDSVGRYALNIQFNDGHKTGIYTFKMLHGLVTKDHHH